jgi:hypothetical protein
VVTATRRLLTTPTESLGRVVVRTAIRPRYPGDPISTTCNTALAFTRYVTQIERPPFQPADVDRSL